FKLNKGLKKLARLSALSIKAKEESILVLEKFNFEAPRTKEFTNILKALELENKKSLFVLDGINNNVYLSSRNLKNIKVVNSSQLNTYSVLNANKVVISEECLEEIESNFSK
ncbi:MAG: 50S ribosomal protein L4, partial [Flavobacteriaceae bacterium]|nr:50S ribosomal protein L4 [Flavobacteriaceae bacterium]